MRCHHRNPTSAIQPAGQDPKARPGAGNGHNTAPFADKRQFFRNRGKFPGGGGVRVGKCDSSYE